MRPVRRLPRRWRPWLNLRPTSAARTRSPSFATVADVRPELGQDQQTSIGPASTLNHQRAEVWRRRAVAEPFVVVVKGPGLVHQINTRLGVFDDSAVLDVAADLPAVG